ncbi:DNA-directed RNA polymerase III subunit RPC1, partial [Cichlidogyrus casuarinus]
MKELYHPPDVNKKVTSIKFQLCKESDIYQLSHVKIMKCLLYGEGQNNRQPLNHGLLDPKLGVTKRDEFCITCGLDYQTCVGHWGHIELPVPVFHVGYLWHILKILQSICKKCSRVLLSIEVRQKFIAACSNPNLEYVQKKSIRKVIHKLASKVRACPYCNALNGFVKKGGFSLMLHDAYRYSKSKLEEYTKYFENLNLKPDLVALAKKGITVIRPSEALLLFQRIPIEDLPLLMMPQFSDWSTHPRDLIIRRIPVPPNALRPSVVSDLKSGTNEDDLTQMYQWILAQAATLEEDISEFDQYASLDNLHAEIYRVINSQQNGLPPVQDQKFMRGLMQRLSGKHGRFRGNLLGKRTNYTARTVITPDPNLRIDEVCVPLHCAKLLTYPERVTAFNIDFLRKLIMNGPYKHPGALFVTYKSPKQTGNDNPRNTILPGQALPTSQGSGQVVKRFLASSNIREISAKHLKPGDVVERHLIDGDVVIFNRQPSLHRVSMQAFRTVIKPFRSLRFNPCCCNPFNADFDGDEMNIHLPQTEEARAEAKHLMSSLKNIVSPKNGEPLISPIQDIITAAHMLTLKDVFFTYDKACQIAAQICAKNQTGLPLQLPPPAIVKPVRLWTGKQIFSLTIKPHPKLNININLATAAKSLYTGKDQDLCANDGFIVLKNSQLLCGSLDKKLLAGGSKSSIYYHIFRDYGGSICADAMWRLNRVALYYLAHRGFSIGIGEVTPSVQLMKAKSRIIQNGFSLCEQFIQQYEKNTLTCNPGCSMEVTLESNLSQELSKIRDQAGAACKSELVPSNSPLIMAQCGSKGSFLNISQMIACVGQQIIGGKRVANVLNGRSLIHFRKGSKFPEAKGFVGNSFYSGLTPPEFFFHAMSGREGLTDTAVKTADTGYMQRRLVKFLEDLAINYDGTVRDSDARIVQFRYGSDGYDPLEMETDNFPVDLKKELGNSCAIFPCPEEPSLDANQVAEIVQRNLEAVEPNFFNAVKPFVDSKVLQPLLDQDFRNTAAADDPKTLHFLLQINRITETQLSEFFARVRQKYERSMMEPGTAVGAICGQSIGEPATQMTLKTFHFAGVASMNITQGVPRMREIVNAVGNIKTPLITVELLNPLSAEYARQVKLNIEPTRLADVALCMRHCITPEEVFILIKLDMARLERRLISVSQIVRAITLAKLRKVKIDRVNSSKEVIQVITSEVNRMELVVQALENVVVKGIPGVARAVIQQSDDGRHRIFVEGPKLRELMCVQGVIPEKMTSNNILEVESVLGIEAARRVVMTELISVMEGHGVEVNVRHVMLLADCMTNRGQVFGYQRNGMAKAKNSVLCLASFERTGDHLFEAAYHGQEDKLRGITERIILGNVLRVGSGMCDLICDRYRQDLVLEPRKTILQRILPSS